MSDPSSTRAFDAPEYDAGYEAGFAAWLAAEEAGREDIDGELPEDTREGIAYSSARYQDGFRDGWGDAMVEHA